MSAERYGPSGTWPRHQKSYWNEALEEARAAGWMLTYLNAPHRFGIVSCPGGDDGNVHSFEVDKTAHGGERFSRLARRLIRTCQHGSTSVGSKFCGRQDKCNRLLDEAERLLSEAEPGLRFAELRTAAWADLDRLEIQLATAAANVAEALLAEEEAWQTIIDTDDAPALDAISATLDNATTAVLSGESIAIALKVRKPRLAKPLLERAHEVRDRIAQLRERLAALM